MYNVLVAIFFTQRGGTQDEAILEALKTISAMGERNFARMRRQHQTILKGRLYFAAVLTF